MQPGRQVTPASATPGDGACSDAAELTAFLAEFFSAYNDGRFAVVRGLLSENFYSYSLTLEENVVAYTRDEAVSRLEARHRAGDRFAFNAVALTDMRAWDGATHYADMVLVLHREGGSRSLTGKGSLYCRGPLRGVRVLALGTP